MKAKNSDVKMNIQAQSIERNKNYIVNCVQTASSHFLCGVLIQPWSDTGVLTTQVYPPKVEYRSDCVN